MTNQPITKTKNNPYPIILISLIVVILCGVAVAGWIGLFYYSFDMGKESKGSMVSQVTTSTKAKAVEFQKITTNLPYNLTQVELATSEIQKMQGLMNRTELCPTCGMLFVYNSQESRTFWMKNTLVSLDIIFLDSQFKVINISQNTKRNQTDELYSSNSPAQYILEVPAGWSDLNQIDENSQITFKTNSLDSVI